ncbi:MAG TPA: cupin domain-containing protein [Actinomycetota bacterium]|nr:cupin domain-containing protein [Actinomycetota bacterium]
MSALERLVGDPAHFLSETYGGTASITVSGRDFSSLGSLDHFDHLINDTLLPAAAFRMVRGGSPLPVRSYTRRFKGHGDDSIRIADPALVFDWFASGATIVLESMHRYSVEMRELCRELENVLRQRTQVNAYITPPNAQGFATHVDSHDVFVVQLHGRKHWIVHPPEDPDGEGDALIERDLVSGDCLYIPKGFAHAATTSTEASAHLTIGLLPTTAGDIAREVTDILKLSSATPAVRSREAGEVADEVIAHLQDRVASVDRAELTRRLDRLFFTTRHHSLRGQLNRMLDAEKLSDPDKLVTRVEWLRYDDGDETVVVLPDRELRFGARLRPALDVVLRDEPFDVADLAAHLDEGDRRALVARLMREGLLELR